MIHTRLILALLVLATLGVLLAPGNRRLAIGGERRITMVVWGQPFEDVLFRDLYARGFEAARPGVRVDYQRHSDVMLKYNAWHARRLGAEVMRLRVTDYHQMVGRGMLLPLDAFIADPSAGFASGRMEQFPAQLIDALRVDGALYALPQDTAQFGLYYNRAIFDAYNAAHPEGPITYPDATWTWETMRDAASRLTTRTPEGGIDVSGFELTLWEWPFMHFFLGAGGELWAADQLTTRVNSEAGVRALEYLGTIVEDGSWKPFFGRQNEGTGPDTRFAAGKVAMMLDGSWMMANLELRNPDLDFAVAIPPRGPGPVRRQIAGSVLWGISTHAPEPALGWAMIDWLTEEPRAVQYWDTLRVAPPAHLGAVASESFKSTRGVVKPGVESPTGPQDFLVPPMPRERFEDRARWILESMTPDPATGEAAAYIPATPHQAVLELEIRRMFMKYFDELGGRSARTPREYLDEVAANVHRDIDRVRAGRGLPPVAR